MKRPTFTELLALAAFCLVAVIPFHPQRDEVVAEYLFEVRMASTTTGELRLYFDDGAGLRESLASATQVFAGPDLVDYRLRVPARELRAIRVDPINTPATLDLTGARITAADGTVVRTFALEEFKPAFQIDALAIEGDRLHVVTTPGGIDPQLMLSFDPPLRLESALPQPLRVSLWRALGLFAVGLIALMTAGRHPAARELGNRVRAWAAARPGRAVAAIAFAAAVFSCHPVVFLGRSFVSPNFSDGTMLLYERFPTLPGYTDARVTDANGSDVGAIAWHHHPLSIIEHRALFRDGELPLWNRYDSAGVTLLGQGQSMFGDPLHIVPIVFNGAGWAWDVKYVLARWLFACGLGLVVLRLTRHAPSAWITALSSAFVGFFLYRVNHPAYFSFCYAPWMLYAWARIADAPTARRAILWICALIVATFAELTSGTAKEAYMLLIGLNFTGAVLALVQPEPWRTTAAKLGLSAAGGVVFAMLSAPIWVTFMDALARAYTSYNNPAAFQILPTLLPGLFDELFYRPIHAELRVLNPSANFLALAGVLYAVATLRRVRIERAFLALGIGAAVPFLIAFGVVPPQWLVKIPFLANVVHIDNTFSCLLIVHLLVLAGYGYRTAAARLGTPEGRGDIVVVAALLVAHFIPYLAYLHTVLREPFGPGTVFKTLAWGQRVPLPAFVLVDLVALPAALLGGLLLVRRALRLPRGWTTSVVLALATCTVVLLWRHGQQTSNALKPYVFSPATRVDFHAVSPAIAYMRAQSAEPYRVVGFNGNLFPGWSAAYDVESISGPDAVANAHYREFAEACGITRIWDWRLYVEAESLGRLRRVYDALGVRYFLDPGTDDPRITRELPRVLRGDLDVYRSDTAWPRAFFTNRIAPYTDAAALGRMIREGDGRPFAAMQAGDTRPPVDVAESLDGRVVTPARDYALTTNSTSFTVETSGPGLIVLHEAWLKGDFRATLNGERVKYVRVNHAFKGIVVDRAGTYRVSFAYWPKRFTETLIAAGIAAAVLLAATVFALRDARRVSAPAAPQA
ncbi:MAG: hypothetical protein IAE82_18700 [Opitutaceae bacterium]|nr:hypothetical protein [Opitutaceae bacterium]